MSLRVCDRDGGGEASHDTSAAAEGQGVAATGTRASGTGATYPVSSTTAKQVSRSRNSCAWCVTVW